MDRLLTVVLGGLASAVVAIALFIVYPETLTDLLGVLVALAAVLVGLRFASNAADSLYPTYDVAEVVVEGPISRDGGGGPLPTTPGATPADDVVEQIDRANEDESVRALLLKLNTPGGEVVPSDDIRLAAERFDGPTVAYATDVCASGGYWIASGCDELWAREARSSARSASSARGSTPATSPRRSASPTSDSPPASSRTPALR